LENEEIIIFLWGLAILWETVYLVICKGKKAGAIGSNVASRLYLVDSNFSVSDFVLFNVNTLIKFPQYSLTLCHSKLTQAPNDFTS
jgi:hypothetical protein